MLELPDLDFRVFFLITVIGNLLAIKLLDINILKMHL